MQPATSNSLCSFYRRYFDDAAAMGFFDFLEKVGEKIKEGIDEAIERRERREAAHRAAALVDMKAMIQTLDDRIPEYRSAVREKVASRIRAKRTSDLLEIRVYKLNFLLGPIHRLTTRPAKNKESSTLEWGGYFVRYLTNKPPEVMQLRAGVEFVVEEAVRDATAEYFSSPEVLAVMQRGIAHEVATNRPVQDIVNGELGKIGSWAKKEAKDVMTTASGAVAADRIHDALTPAAHAFAGTAVGHVVLSALSMPAIKTAIFKLAALAVAHEGVRGVVMKAGVTTLLTVFFGHAAASSIFLFAAIPAVVALMVYHYNAMPNTLADKIPDKIAAAMGEKAPAMNKKVVAQFTEKAFEVLLDHIHDMAMEEQGS